MREVGKISSRGGKNKEERLKSATEKYIKLTKKLSKKIEEVLSYNLKEEKEIRMQIEIMKYHEILSKQIELLRRRIIEGEKIPHKEKIISIFQPFVELINKEKRNVEIGKKVAITTNENNMIVDWQICNNETDEETIIPIIDRLLSKYKIKSISVDKGYSSKYNKELISLYIEEVIMPKKGKLNKEEKEEENKPKFKKYRRKHNAIESNINELEHRGLNKCYDRTENNFKRYIGLSCVAYNLHKIGRLINITKKKKEIKGKKAA